MEDNSRANTTTGQDDAVQLVLAIYDPGGKYCRHAGALLTSIFSRTSSRVRVTVLHDDTLTGGNRTRLERAAGVFGQDIRFVDVSGQLAGESVDLDMAAGEFSRGTLFRLLIPRLVNLPKVIYMDCDVIVNLDIAELWNVRIGDYALAAVSEKEISDTGRNLRDRIRAWVMRYDAEKYFNAGVMLMNLDRIREPRGEAPRDMMRDAMDFLTRYRFCADYADQDFLNAAFGSDTLYIDGRFNRIRDHDNADNAILHFIRGRKPWIPHPWNRGDYLYWNEFARSEWRDQLVPAMLEMYSDSEYLHRRVSDCVRHLGKRLRRELITRGLLRAARDASACLAEFYRRFKIRRNFGNGNN